MGEDTKVHDLKDQGEKAPKELANGPFENRGCTDIICCLIFIAANAAFVYAFILGRANGNPSMLLAVWDGSSKNHI